MELYKVQKCVEALLEIFKSIRINAIINYNLLFTDKKCIANDLDFITQPRK